jgi:copper chaperone
MTTSITLNVPDISCAHCKSSIEGAVTPMGGVASAHVTIEERTVAVDFDDSEVSVDEIITAIEDQGYTVTRS